MADVISEYQKWKQQGEGLRVQAKQAMETRFREVLSEAVRIAEEYRADFGTLLKPPPPVTAFRFKAAARNRKPSKPKPAAKPPAGPAEVRPEPRNEKPDPKIVRLRKRLALAKKRVEEAKAAGLPARSLEDRVYELDDELRLSTHPA